MTLRENPDAAPPVETTSERMPLAASAPDSLATAPEPVLLENPRAVAAAPSESMEGAVTVERDGTIAALAAVHRAVKAAAPLELEPVTPDAEPTTLENPKPPTPAPSEGTADVVTLEASTPAPSGPTVAAAPPAAVAPSPPQAVRTVPRRPRLRTTFWYDARDDLNVELTLMDDRRELLHRMTLTVAPGGTIARICEALLGVVTSAAASAGVFGSRER